MKTLMYGCAMVLLLAGACKNDAPSTSDELKQKRQELESKKKELQDLKEIAKLEQELAEVDKAIEKVDGVGQTGKGVASQPGQQTSGEQLQRNLGTENRGTINGTGVVLRKGPSVKSDKLANFNNGEIVGVLESRNVNNDNEAILVKQIDLYASANSTGPAVMSLNKGKAVVIEEYNVDNNNYYVSYMDPKKGKLYAYVGADALETIAFATWIRVRRSNGQEGWVLGKFLTQ